MNIEEEILRNLWKDHCQIIGEKGVAAIIDSQKHDKNKDVSVIIPKGGSMFDISPSLEILTAALVLIKTVIEVIQKIREQKKEKPKPYEIRLIVEQEIKVNSLPIPVIEKIDDVIETVNTKYE